MLSETNTLVKSLTPITSKHQRFVSLKRAFRIAYQPRISSGNTHLHKYRHEIDNTFI